MDQSSQESNTNNRPTRHPILDRLENNDYDFNGQSLDYEPNLEFDDTDLKQDIEEELEQMNANLLLMNLTTTTNNQHQDDVRLNNETDQLETDQQQQVADQEGGGGGGDEQQVAVENDIFIEHLRSQLYLQRASPAYLESPQDLLEENFEEAFKSSLFELEHDHQANMSPLKAGSSSNNNLLNTRSNSSKNGKLNSFLKSATSGFYVNKQNLLNDTLDELRIDEDDFENEDFSDIAQHNCVEVAGDDLFGRRIITIYACRLPNDTKIHHLRLLKYIMYTLDQYVENDYCVVYFHYGLNSQNKPKLNFLYQAYKAFDRKYKKNLKALFLVHPTNFIRIVWQLFKPVIR